MLATTAFAVWVNQFVVWTFPSPSAEFAVDRVPAVKSLHLLFQSDDFQSLARDYPANGFPDFDRSSRASFFARSPLQSQIQNVTVIGGK
jgi:hypothetical protein